MNNSSIRSSSRTPTILWLILFSGAWVWHGWLTLNLFCVQNSYRALWNDWPIICGKHPLHLYHGYVGAKSLLESGSICCYDPNFEAGYPKTPVFDSGSRPGELFLAFSGGDFRPDYYKI